MSSSSNRSGQLRARYRATRLAWIKGDGQTSLLLLCDGYAINLRTYVGQELGGRHAAHDDQITQDDLQVVGPELAQSAPQLLDVAWMGVRELKND